MSIVVVGFLAYDTVETPNWKSRRSAGRRRQLLCDCGAIFFSGQRRRGGRFGFQSRGYAAVHRAEYRHARNRQGARADDAMARPLSRRPEHARHHLAVAERARRLHAGFAAGSAPRGLSVPRAERSRRCRNTCWTRCISPKVVVADLYDYWIENTRPGLDQTARANPDAAVQRQRGAAADGRAQPGQGGARDPEDGSRRRF